MKSPEEYADECIGLEATNAELAAVFRRAMFKAQREVLLSLSEFCRAEVQRMDAGVSRFGIRGLFGEH